MAMANLPSLKRKPYAASCTQISCCSNSKLTTLLGNPERLPLCILEMLFKLEPFFTQFNCLFKLKVFSSILHRFSSSSSFSSTVTLSRSCFFRLTLDAAAIACWIFGILFVTSRFTLRGVILCSSLKRYLCFSSPACFIHSSLHRFRNLISVKHNFRCCISSCSSYNLNKRSFIA